MKLTQNPKKLLALKLFVLLGLLNGFLLILIWPQSETNPEITKGHLQLKIRATIYGDFRPRDKLLLAPAGGMPVATALLVEIQPEAVVIEISEETYRRFYQRLIQEEWSLIPHLEGMQNRITKTKGVSYEIAY